MAHLTSLEAELAKAAVPEGSAYDDEYQQASQAAVVAANAVKFYYGVQQQYFPDFQLDWDAAGLEDFVTAAAASM